jgi:hypothetical protein
MNNRIMVYDGHKYEKASERMLLMAIILWFESLIPLTDL